VTAIVITPVTATAIAIVTVLVFPRRLHDTVMEMNLAQLWAISSEIASVTNPIDQPPLIRNQMSDITQRIRPQMIENLRPCHIRHDWTRESA
jgi:glucan phosphorylase